MIPYNTGRVLIGSKCAPPQRWADTTASEDRIQAALLNCPHEPRVSRWALFGPLLFTVLALALLNVVTQRNEERRAIVSACEAAQLLEGGNPAACRLLFIASKGGR